VCQRRQRAGGTPRATPTLSSVYSAKSTCSVNHGASTAATARGTRWGAPRLVAQLTRAEPGACHREALHYTSTDELGGSLSVRTARARASRAQPGLDTVSQTPPPQHVVSPSARGAPALPRAPQPGGLAHAHFAARHEYLATRGAHRPSARAPRKVCPGRPPRSTRARGRGVDAKMARRSMRRV
jgi:hypothetical protein